LLDKAASVPSRKYFDHSLLIVSVETSNFAAAEAHTARPSRLLSEQRDAKKSRRLFFSAELMCFFQAVIFGKCCWKVLLFSTAKIFDCRATLQI
jgi:hypothetical protein